MAKSQANPLRKSVNGFIRWLIDGDKPQPINPTTPNGLEAKVRDRLAKELNGKTEVSTPVGRIDILTKTEVIEVKKVTGWKGAIGQVKSYGKYHPNHKLRIHLFGAMTEIKLKTIQEHYESEGITLTWE